MIREIRIALPMPLAGVELVDPDAPLPAAPAVVQANERERAEQERQTREDRAAIERVLAALTTAARSVTEQQRQALVDMRRAAVELGVTIAARILHEKVRAEDFAVEALVRQAVERLEPRQAVTVRLHPTDLALLERRLAGQPSLFPDTAEVRVIADASRQRGDCLAESGDVSVLSQLEGQLAEIRHHLLRSLENAGTGH